MATPTREQRIAAARQEFSDHLLYHRILRYNLSVAVFGLSLNKQVWNHYLTFFHYAHAVSTSEVRVFDILSWYKNVDDQTMSAVQKLQDYYHKEARLFYKLKKLEGNVPAIVERDLVDLRGEDGASASMTFDAAIGMDCWRWEDTYAIAFDDNAPRFGYETDLPGLGALDLRFTDGGLDHSRYIVLEILANFELRLVRLLQADMSDRYGAVSWDESVDSRVVDWIEQAIEVVPERHGELRDRMQSWVDCLARWKDELHQLMVLRIQKKQLMGGRTGGAPSRTWKAEMKALKTKIRDELDRLVELYGPRTGWDWEE